MGKRIKETKNYKENRTEEKTEWKDFQTKQTPQQQKKKTRKKNEIGEEELNEEKDNAKMKNKIVSYLL